MRKSEIKELQKQVAKLQESVDALPKWSNFEDLLLSDIVSSLLNARFYKGVMKMRDAQFDNYVETCRAANKSIGHRIRKEGTTEKIHKVKVRKVASKRIRS